MRWNVKNVRHVWNVANVPDVPNVFERSLDVCPDCQAQTLANVPGKLSLSKTEVVTGTALKIIEIGPTTNQTVLTFGVKMKTNRTAIKAKIIKTKQKVFKKKIRKKTPNHNQTKKQNIVVNQRFNGR